MRRTGFAVMGDHPEAAAGQRGEGFGVVGRSWHASRIRSHEHEGAPGSSHEHWRPEQGGGDLVADVGQGASRAHVAIRYPPRLMSTMSGMMYDPSWLDPTSAWSAKADRVQNHLRSLDRLVAEFRASEPYTVVPWPTDIPGRTEYRLQIHKQMPVEISPTIGDILHNLRSLSTASPMRSRCAAWIAP